jgi:PAS domain S-box-containing protein
MQDADKSKEQLITELKALRQRVAELEKDKGTSTDPAELRRRAKDCLKAGQTETDQSETDDTKSLYHELATHRIELEMQNEELRNALVRIEESLTRYSDLYDFAPIGYLTLDENGLVLEANLTITRQLDIERPHLVGRPLPAYIVMADRDAFSYHLGNVLKDKTHQACEVRFMKGSGGDFRVLLDTIFIMDADGERRVRTSVTDITRSKRTEEALKERERKFRAIFDQTFQFIWLITIDGRLKEVNKTALLFAGVRESDVIGEPFWETPWWTYSKELQEKLRAAANKAAAGECVRFEATLPSADGSLHCVDFSLKPAMDEAGGVTFLIAEARDTTERKRFQEALQESETRCRLLADNATDVIWTVGMDMRLTYVSPSVTRLLGFTVEEAMARTMEQAYTPAAFEKAMQIFAEEMAIESAGHIDPARSRMLELELVRKDGNTVPVEGNFCFLRDPTGKAIGILSMVRDITERKRAEEALRESKAYLAATIESIPFEFWVIGPDGHYTMQNRICRERYGDIIGKRPEDICPNESILSIWLDNNRRASSGELVKGEVRFVFGNEERYFYNVVAPIHDRDRAWGILGINFDITERKRLEAALEKINEELERQVEERTNELDTKNRSLEEFNAALKVLLKQREEDRTELEESILLNVKTLIVPYVEKLKKSRLGGDQMTYLTILESHMREIISPFTKRLSDKYLGLTPLEVQVAGLIKEGKTTKEIAESLVVSVNTVSAHRFHIRKKLGLNYRKVNLRVYLKSLKK